MPESKDLEPTLLLSAGFRVAWAEQGGGEERRRESEQEFLGGKETPLGILKNSVLLWGG